MKKSKQRRKVCLFVWVLWHINLCRLFNPLQRCSRCILQPQTVEYTVLLSPFSMSIPDIGLAVRVFANSPGDLSSIPGRVIPKTQKWYLMPPCLTLSIVKYVSRVKWSNPGKGVTPSPTPWCSSYRKGSLRVTLDYGRQLLIPDIGLAVRVFANHPGDLGSILGRVIPKTQKMVLDASLLNT